METHPHEQREQNILHQNRSSRRGSPSSLIKTDRMVDLVKSILSPMISELRT